MDDARFDALARLFGSVAERRATVRALVGGVFGALGLATNPNAKARKKKKRCKKPKAKCGKKCCAAGQVCRSGKCALPECVFDKTADLWTLQGDCGTAEPIAIPDGVTLEGQNKTISVGGDPSDYLFSGGIAVQDGGTANVRNVTVVGDGLCVAFGIPLIAFRGTSGRIEDVTVEDVDGCNLGIVVFGGTGATVDIDGADIIGGDQGIFYNSNSGTVSNSAIRGTRIGIDVANGADVTVDGNTLDDVDTGVRVSGGANATVTGNTLVGPGSIARDTAGIVFAANATGSASGNTVSEFFDSRTGPDELGCGILVSETAGAVTIGANDFTVPPANEEDVCDNRP